MPKKKKRALNIAKRREKRKQDKKKRRKTILSERNRNKTFPRFDEERLGEKIFKSSILADEPEFSELTFDTKLALEYGKEIWEEHRGSESSNEEDEEDEEVEGEDLDDEILYDEYRAEVIQKLLTEDFTRKLTRTLKACATRLTRTGNNDKAELAIITLTMIEFTDGFPLSIHPLITTIYERTMKVVIDELAESETDETMQELLTFLKNRKEPHSINLSEVMVETKETAEKETDEEEEQEPIPEPQTTAKQISDDNELPAKALYKVLNFEKVKNIIDEQEHLQPLSEDGDEVEFMNANTQSYITLRQERLFIKSSSKKQLEESMNEIEKLCEGHLMYLAKSISNNNH